MGKWAKIGNVVKSKENNGQYIKFADNITVLKDSEEMDMNVSRTANIIMFEATGMVLGEILIKKEKIAEIRKGKEGKPNYVSFDKNVSFKVDAVPFKANKDNVAHLQDPVQNLEKLIKLGKVKEEDVESRRDKVKQIATWLIYEVVAPDNTTK